MVGEGSALQWRQDSIWIPRVFHPAQGLEVRAVGEIQLSLVAVGLWMAFNQIDMTGERFQCCLLYTSPSPRDY